LSKLLPIIVSSSVTYTDSVLRRLSVSSVKEICSKLSNRLLLFSHLSRLLKGLISSSQSGSSPECFKSIICFLLGLLPLNPGAPLFMGDDLLTGDTPSTVFSSTLFERFLEEEVISFFLPLLFWGEAFPKGDFSNYTSIFSGLVLDPA
jgi:hypothetical protein